jgi:hypothetical protein
MSKLTRIAGFCDLAWYGVTVLTQKFKGVAFLIQYAQMLICSF